jgi:hypothetical protein
MLDSVSRKLSLTHATRMIRHKYKGRQKNIEYEE